jgi:hypothetical protein
VLRYNASAKGLFAVLIIVIALLLEQHFLSSDRAQYLNAVVGSTATSHEIAFVRDAIQSIARKTGESRNILVNGEFDESAINVALVDKYEFPELGEVKRGFGIRVISPNILLIDVAFVRDVLLASLNDLNYYNQLYDSLGENAEHYLTPPEDAGDSLSRKSAETFGAISLQLRLENFSQGFEVSKRYGAMIAEELANTAPELRPDFFIPFTFPISHELYHLKRNRKVALSAVSEELAADEYAVSQIHQEAKRYGDSGYIERRKKQLLFIGVRYLQDRVLSEVFHRFRGNDADAYFSALYHVECKYAKSIPWPLRFNNPGSIRIGEYRHLPLMSDKEIITVRHFIDELEDSEHPNLLHRIALIADAFDADVELGESSKLVFEKSRALLAIYTTGLATRTMSLPDVERGTGGSLRSDSLVKTLGGTVQPTSAYGCDMARCTLARVGFGYAELLSEGGRIDVGTHVQPPTPNGFQSLEITAEQYIGVKSAKALMSKIRTSHSECRLASGIYRGSAYVVTVRTMNQDGWIELRAYAVQ